MIVLPAGLLAQTLRIDSLQSLLPQVQQSKRTIVLLQLSSEYIDVGCHRRAIEVATDAMKLSKMFHDSLSFVKSIRYKAMAFREINQLDSSLKLLKDILPIAKRIKDVEEIKFILNGLGITSSFKASYDQALIYYFAILELPLNSKGVTEQVVLTNIGAVFYKLKEYLTALNYFNRARQLGNPGNQIIEINTILCYAHLGRLSEANKGIEKIEVSFKGRLSAEMEMHFFFAQGIVAMFENDLTKAKAFFLKSLALSKMQGDDRISLDNLISLSKLDTDQGLFHLAEHYLQQANEIITEESTYNLELIQVYAQLSLISSKMLDFKKCPIINLNIFNLRIVFIMR